MWRCCEMVDGSFMATWTIYMEHVMVFICGIACSTMVFLLCLIFCLLLFTCFFAVYSLASCLPPFHVWVFFLPSWLHLFIAAASCMEAPMVILRITRDRL